MKYQDKIYGEFKIDKPVILDLIRCPSFQRMKGIDQHGHFEPHFSGTGYSRFEHSLGVFILLKKHRASLLEQIAGLLHDVSHTVFSHVADYIFRDGSGDKQNFQDSCHQEFLESSEIPEILKKYRIDYKDILDDTNFFLKERELPDLCADRIDYFLRDVEATGKITVKEIKKFIDDFTIVNNLWVFKSKDLAKKYAYLFLEINNWFWSGIEAATMLKTTGEVIKCAIKKKIITKDDLYTTDNEVWAKIRPVTERDGELRVLLDRADNKFRYKSSSKYDYDLCVTCKSRVVDPYFLENNILKRVSEIDKGFVKLKEKYLKPKKYYIKFLGKRD